MTGILVALDMPDLEGAERLAIDLRPHVTGFKVGMELLMSEGPRAITAIAALGRPVFADAKLHDIPNTVGRATSRIKEAGARWVTVHAAGGREMIEAAVAAMEGEGVLTVTMLTSLSRLDLVEIGIEIGVSQYVSSMASLGYAAGAEGAVCSAEEISTVKTREPGLKVFTPGVRPAGMSANDQKRVATPERASADGADFVVIGRPITMAEDPVGTAREIGASMAGLGRSVGSGE